MITETSEFTVNQVRRYRAVSAASPDLYTVLNGWYMGDDEGNPKQYLPEDIMQRLIQDKAVFIMDESTGDVAVVEESVFALSYEFVEADDYYKAAGNTVLTNLVEKLHELQEYEADNDEYIRGLSDAAKLFISMVGN